jgi:Holliday junction resolvase RusA-like endonuclease
MIEITLHGIAPAPQGSGRAMLIGGKARFIATSSNGQGKRLRAYRQALNAEARRVIFGETYFQKHVPVSLDISFFFIKPPSCPKSRHWPVVMPDIDKALRSTNDALTGVLFHDDAQVVEVVARKIYASFEGVRIVAKEAGTTGGSK